MSNNLADVSVSDPVFSTRANVHFDDLDALGMMYHGRYPALVDRACIDCCAGRGFPLGHEDMLVVFRAFDIQFHEPIRTAGPVEIEFRSTRTSRSTHTFTFVVKRGDVLHATGSRTFTKIDPATGRSKPWTDEVRAVFQANDVPSATPQADRVAVS